MTNISRFISFVFMTSLLLTVGSCEKPDTQQPQPEERKNFFTYETYSFDINSVVKYDKGDNAIELWLSPESGLNTIAQIEKSGDYVVLNTHAGYLGSRDRFNAQSSKDSYIRFGNNLQYKYGDAGVAYIEVQIEGEQITLSFLAQNLHAKSAEPVKAQLQGSYSGTYVIEKEKAYENEWGINRKHNPIDKVVLTMREDDGDWSVKMLHNDGTEGIRIEFPSEMMDQEIVIGGNDKSNRLKLYYNGGIEFPLKDAVGWIKILNDINDKTLTVSISLIKDETHLRAEFAGGFTPEIIKLNRFRFTYDGESPYEGEHTIVKLMVEELGNNVKLYFSPSEGYTIGNANSTHMPILIVPKSSINAGAQTFSSLTDWSFEYDVMQVWPYVDEYRPHPDQTDMITINQDGAEYEIDMRLSGIATGMNSSYMDLYYKGKAQK